MTTTNTEAAATRYRIGNAYEIRDDLRRVGGRWLSGSKVWELTAEQYAEILERVAVSASRSNKRDTALARGWERVSVTEVQS